MSEFDTEIIYVKDRNTVLFGNGFYLDFVFVTQIKIEGEIFFQFLIVPSRECMDYYNVKKENLIYPDGVIQVRYPKDNVHEFFSDDRGTRYFVSSGVMNEPTNYQESEVLIDEINTLNKQMRALRKDRERLDEERDKLISNPSEYILKNIDWIRQVKTNIIPKMQEQTQKENEEE